MVGLITASPGTVLGYSQGWAHVQGRVDGCCGEGGWCQKEVLECLHLMVSAPLELFTFARGGRCPAHACCELASSSGLHFIPLFRSRVPSFGPPDSCQCSSGLVFRASIVLCLSAWGRPRGKKSAWQVSSCPLLTPPCPGFPCRASVRLWMLKLLSYFCSAEPAPGGCSHSSLCLSLGPP